MCFFNFYAFSQTPRSLPPRPRPRFAPSAARPRGRRGASGRACSGEPRSGAPCSPPGWCVIQENEDWLLDFHLSVERTPLATTGRARIVPTERGGLFVSFGSKQNDLRLRKQQISRWIRSSATTAIWVMQCASFSRSHQLRQSSSESQQFKTLLLST